MTKLCKVREVKRELYENLVIPKVVYGSETLSLNAQERIKLELFEMMFLRKTRDAR